jgi:hypothetical protein
MYKLCEKNYLAGFLLALGWLRGLRVNKAKTAQSIDPCYSVSIYMPDPGTRLTLAAGVIWYCAAKDNRLERLERLKVHSPWDRGKYTLARLTIAACPLALNIVLFGWPSGVDPDCSPA